MMPVMMMTVVIIYHNSLQEQITQDNLSLFYFEPNQQILQTTPTIMLHYKFHRFFAISTGRPGRWQSPFHPPRNTNRVFKAFSISRNSPSDVNKRNSILDKHRRFQFDSSTSPPPPSSSSSPSSPPSPSTLSKCLSTSFMS